ncbi:MAG: right-handed parallel beta-helix repeat-containing protein [Nocardioides sp.]|nr:right-handed parallel beta-helix repeat-containing protein [Nocardioides sp.]
MSGDYSRLTFDPRRGFSGVRKQQGRVSLDSDFNELEAILDRRDRATTYDIVGPAVYPATTPTAFEIVVTGPGKVTIGPGRAYVDGICAECFGDLSNLVDAAKSPFDPHLGNRVGAAPLAYENQPFFYAPGFPTVTTAAGTASQLYLDVWQREVTVYEDERLIEPALGGPDTDTRMQTAWQVKALDGDVGLTCATDLPAWTTLTAPSSARLSSESTPVAPSAGPCVVSPVGDYTGLENRLYRVEVHHAGTLGGATKAQFKWSRDNASLAASVTKIVSAPGSQSVIDVSSTGRDSWMRFEVDQHLELLDDHVEFAMRESGTGGPMVKILDVNHATGEILVDQDLSAFVIATARHPRVRRWDSAAPTEPLVRDAGVNVAIALEEGITVTFNGVAADTLHAGDYWVIAARTVEGTSETLVHEPPRGIHHHYMKLGVVTAGSTKVDPCRVEWPPKCTCEDGEGCGCDACVTLESHDSGDLTIQAAVDQVIAAGGGTVCIGIGIFLVQDTVTVTGGVSIRIKGSGVNTVIHHRSGGAAMIVEGCVDLGIRALTLVTEREGDQAQRCLQVGNSAFVDLERLNVIDDPLGLVQFLGNTGVNENIGAALALDGLVLGLSVTRCLLAGASAGVAPLGALDNKRGGLVTADLTFRDNVIVAGLIGVLLGTLDGTTPVIHLDGTTVDDNSVYGCLQAGLQLGGEVPFGVIRVSNNVVSVFGTGCVVGTDHTTLVANTLLGIARDSEQERFGVQLIGGAKAQLVDVHVADNEIARFTDSGVRLDGAFTEATFTDNTIAGCGGGVNMTMDSSGDVVTVSGNRIRDITGRGRDVVPAGVTLVRVAQAGVHDNIVDRVSADDSVFGAFGVATLGCAAAHFSRNQVHRVRSDRGPEFSAGIGLFETFEAIDVADNIVGVESKEGFALLIGWSRREKPNWARLLVDTGEARFWLSATSVTKLVRRDNRLPSHVGGNLLRAAGEVPCVLVTEPTAGIFDDNQCHHDAGQSPIVEIDAFSLAFTSNQVRAEQENVAVRLRIGDAGFFDIDNQQFPSEALTVLGNLTNGQIEVNGNPLGNPWSPLNIRMS